MTSTGWLRIGLLMTVAACGGGDGGGGGGGGPVAPPSGISFAASGGSATNGLVLRHSSLSTQSLLRLDLQAQGMTNLYGVAFDLLYPNQILTFNAASEGTFLGGTSTSLQVEEIEPGRLVVGLSRLGNAPGATGNGVVVSFEFATRFVAGSGPISFTKNNAFSPTGGPIAGVSWGGGSVTVVP